MRSVIGSLAWVARQCRPELAYLTSRLQSVVNAAQVKHLEECNRAVQLAREGSENCLTYKARAFDFQDAVLVTVTDASFANEEKRATTCEIFPRRSQMGRFTLLADSRIWTHPMESVPFAVLGYKSSLIKRVCRSTLQAETQSLTGGVEEGDRLRAAITLMKGIEEKDWLTASRENLRHLWLTDCASLEQYCNRPVAAGAEDKRLEIDLEALRQPLWEDPAGNPKDSLGESQTEQLRWIDTSAMLSDCLTKQMASDFLLKSLQTCVLVTAPTPESMLAKMAKQKGRAKAREKRQALK